MSEREQWGTRAGFLLAAIGSAVGLGNIWRFPYVAYEGGGGAFLVPYLVALVTAGLPLLILVYAIGHRYRGSPPVALRRISRPAEAIGWWQVGISFIIAIYYAVIIAWAIRYVGFAVTEQWGEDTAAFFDGFIGSAAEPGMISAYVPGVVWPLLLVWIVTLGVLAFGVRRGIERANKIFIPLLAILFCLLVAQAVTLDGAAQGLDALFTPDWGAITDGAVWVSAYGQIFFSLSIGFGIMITYASYLRRRADLTGSALVAGFANSSFEVLAGIGVFAALGFMAFSDGVAVDEVVESGIGLAFMAFPEIISTMPLGALFGILFFVSLVVAGLSSLISIVQVVVAAVQDRFGISRTAAVAGVGGGTAVVSVALFPTDQGLVVLDVVDRFINSYGIAAASLVLLIVVAWVLRRLPDLKRHAERYSSIPLTGWWIACLGVITPLVLGWMLVDTLREEFAERYGDYPLQLLVGLGGGVAVGVIVVAVVLTLVLRNREVPALPDPDETNVDEGSR
ncbi:sodium-dependent transporter [Lipingzhangella sp. LS1_29]|uniref:Sodium-dependent transporter n=1 Tax=Lipingzhangella rawalii TaxID=2055835 RepID=A0ABU2H5P9_9ACTN|nr:sodium-dependent transporter [Lipingzhangella rawalii]MDS1270332.1 sodium-dependent transporter [Lipingzhangella rawalii]